MTVRRAVPTVMIGVALLSVLGACRSGGVATQPPPTTSATPSSGAASPERAILAQYRSFWPLLAKASLAPDASAKRRLLAPFVADPALSSVVSASVEQNRQGRIYAGVDIIHAQVLTFDLHRGVAVVRDCQDSSRAGLRDRHTGRLLTRGPRGNPVNATLHLVEGAWRIVFIQHPGGRCSP